MTPNQPKWPEKPLKSAWKEFPSERRKAIKNTAAQIAATILKESAARKIDVSNLKLQQLLYYCEAWSLALDDCSLFSEPIEAWIQGPVVNDVFRSYKEYSWAPIAFPRPERASSAAIKKHVNTVLEAYGEFSVIELERLTNGEQPWLEARNGLESNVRSREHIKRETMRTFYSAKIVPQRRILV